MSGQITSTALDTHSTSAVLSWTVHQESSSAGKLNIGNNSGNTTILGKSNPILQCIRLSDGKLFVAFPTINDVGNPMPLGWMTPTNTRASLVLNQHTFTSGRASLTRQQFLLAPCGKRETVSMPACCLISPVECLLLSCTASSTARC